MSEDYPHAPDGDESDHGDISDSSQEQTEPQPASASAAQPPVPPPKPSPTEAPAAASAASTTSTTPPDQKLFKVIGSYRTGVLRFVREELVRLGFTETTQDSPDINVYWSRSFYSRLASLLPHQKVNFLPAMAEICRKDFLNRNIKKAAARVGYEHFDFWPISFNLPAEYNEFVQEFTRNPVPYILKPPLAARGEGIRLATKLDDVDVSSEFIVKKHPLAQRYIPDPMLFNGHKMTFRIYVVVTSFDPLRIYVYPNGLVRICSQKYTTEETSFKDLLVHLTNWDLQKDHEGQFNDSMAASDIKHDGLRSDLKYILEGIESVGGNVDKLWQDIRQLIAKSVIAAEPVLQHWASRKLPLRNQAFELMGYDILIDTQLKPWLLEINHTPSLSPHTDLENEIKAEMLRELLQLVDVEQKWTQATQERTDELFEAIQDRLSGLKCSWQQPGGSISIEHLSRMDVWTIVDTDFENGRRGQWIRVFPEADSVSLLPLLVTPNRNKMLVNWVGNNLTWEGLF